MPSSLSTVRVDGSTVLVTALQLVLHGVGALLLLAQSAMRPVERELRGVRVAIDPDLLGDSIGELLVDHGKDRTLLGDDPLLPTSLHVGRDVLDESLLGNFIEHSLPQVSGLVKVLLPDLGQESDGVADKVLVNVVQSDRTGLELDRVDRGQEVGTSASTRVSQVCMSAISIDETKVNRSGKRH